MVDVGKHIEASPDRALEVRLDRNAERPTRTEQLVRAAQHVEVRAVRVDLQEVDCATVVSCEVLIENNVFGAELDRLAGIEMLLCIVQLHELGRTYRARALEELRRWRFVFGQPGMQGDECGDLTRVRSCLGLESTRPPSEADRIR